MFHYFGISNDTGETIYTFPRKLFYRSFYRHGYRCDNDYRFYYYHYHHYGVTRMQLYLRPH